MMLPSLVVVMLAALPLQTGQDAPPADETVDITSLQAAVTALSEASGYTFERTSKSEGFGGGGGGGRGGGGSGASADPIIGHVLREQPLHVSLGETEAWRQGETMIYRQGSESWQQFEMPEWGEGGRGGGRRGGGAGRGGDFRSMRGLMTLQSSAPPHEFLQDFETHFVNIQRAEQEGRTIYTGDLTEDGALTVGGGMLGRMRRGGGDIDITGTFRIVLTENGMLDTLTFHTQLAGYFGDREFARDQQVEIVLSAIDETELDVPQDVAAALAGEDLEAEEEEEIVDEDETPDDESDSESRS
jgi:hypothetical protein